MSRSIMCYERTQHPQTLKHMWGYRLTRGLGEWEKGKYRERELEPVLTWSVRRSEPGPVSQSECWGLSLQAGCGDRAAGPTHGCMDGGGKHLFPVGSTSGDPLSGSANWSLKSAVALGQHPYLCGKWRVHVRVHVFKAHPSRSKVSQIRGASWDGCLRDGEKLRLLLLFHHLSQTSPLEIGGGLRQQSDKTTAFLHAASAQAMFTSLYS